MTLKYAPPYIYPIEARAIRGSRKQKEMGALFNRTVSWWCKVESGDIKLRRVKALRVIGGGYE